MHSISSAGSQHGTLPKAASRFPELNLEKPTDNHRSEVYPPWDKRSDWNTFLRQSLAINHNIVGQLQLTPINILIQCQSPMAAKYLSLHAARLLCQLFIHWEFLPFLPVNCVRPVGLGQEARQIYEAADAPTGFWLSNARMCFQAARSILDLASFVENHVSLMEDAFTSYAVFVASFIRIYARAFPWMDVEQQLAQCEAPPIFAGNLRHFDSSASQSTTPKPPGDESIVSLNDEWSVTLASIAKYFEDFKLDYYTTSLSESYFVSDICVNQLRSRRCLRDGGAGEGLEEYKLFRSKLRNFGHE